MLNVADFLAVSITFRRICMLLSRPNSAASVLHILKNLEDVSGIRMMKSIRERETAQHGFVHSICGSSDVGPMAKDCRGQK